MEAPNYQEVEPDSVKVFLAGGTSNCPNWQLEIVEIFSEVCSDKVVMFNPRREDWRFDNGESYRQIKWESEHLSRADIIAFWFAKGSVNPISLFEYGYYGLGSNRTIVVGADMEYSRKYDIMVQTKIIREEQHVCESFKRFRNELLTEVKATELERKKQEL